MNAAAGAAEKAFPAAADAVISTANFAASSDTVLKAAEHAAAVDTAIHPKLSHLKNHLQNRGIGLVVA